jgi:hypothetical protein
MLVLVPGPSGWWLANPLQPWAVGLCRTTCKQCSGQLLHPHPRSPRALGLTRCLPSPYRRNICASERAVHRRRGYPRCPRRGNGIGPAVRQLH